MMMALRSTLNTATSFLEMSEYLSKSLITQNYHGNPGFHHAKEHGWHICGDLCLILQSPKERYSLLWTYRNLQGHFGALS